MLIMTSLDVLAEAAKFVQDDDGSSSPQSGKYRLQKAGRSQSRETHNRLEKNRRAELKNYFQRLKNNIPKLMTKSKASTVSILTEAQLYIEELKAIDKQNERERISLHRCRICLEERLKMLKTEINQLYLQKQFGAQPGDSTLLSDNETVESESETPPSEPAETLEIKDDGLDNEVEINEVDGSIVNKVKEVASVQVQANEEEIQAENLPLVFPRVPLLSESAARFDITALQSSEEEEQEAVSTSNNESLTKLQSMVYRVGNIETTIPDISVTTETITIDDSTFLTCNPNLTSAPSLTSAPILTSTTTGFIDAINLDKICNFNQVCALNQVVNLQFLQPKENSDSGDDQPLQICEDS